MRVIEARNPHQALIKGMHLLNYEGHPRASRGGEVLVMPCPVTTVYHNPVERVVFWPQRDANPFFHLYESLWMLAGRNDVTPLLRYAKNMANYADEGVIHGAYGMRWRRWFRGKDQLDTIVRRLRTMPDDRRCVLQMWDVETDLGANKRDLPCNTIATFQRNEEGALDLTVFCRSNDIIWGAYGANAVHFSVLLEYMAMWIGCPVGKYYQVSVNWHAYVEVFEPMMKAFESGPDGSWDPYRDNQVAPTRMHGPIEQFDQELKDLLHIIDNESPVGGEQHFSSPFLKTAYRVLKAHEIFRNLPAPERYFRALDWLDLTSGGRSDWFVAARQWILRREAIWEEKMANGKDQIQA